MKEKSFNRPLQSSPVLSKGIQRFRCCCHYRNSVEELNQPQGMRYVYRCRVSFHCNRYLTCLKQFCEFFQTVQIKLLNLLSCI